MGSIPVMLCGKNPTMASNFSDAMKPEYDVVHVCHSLEAFKTEIPALVNRTSPPKPSSGMGSNNDQAAHDYQVPKAIVVGKGFSEDEIKEMQSIESLKGKVVWLLPDTGKFTWGMIGKAVVTGGTALPGVIAERAKKCLESNGMVAGKERDGDDVGGGEESKVWYF
ncbi:hypothetical protein BDV96DRAFT_594090 [Lophiotrema nucula]|uniref:Uncharacterized protein n=1 Tax=Lophiotrema nucula TaxID=690887 RepID=A0A6A5ZV06_9PLEO|nr:hypothetical protein BDV96DRAFT_594090 [Lophiotrema nucula]